MTKTDDGMSLALRCLQAMEGQDDETKKSLWLAAKRYAARDRGKRTRERFPLLRVTEGAGSAGLTQTGCW